jgi:hypothetical protein
MSRLPGGMRRSDRGVWGPSRITAKRKMGRERDAVGPQEGGDLRRTPRTRTPSPTIAASATVVGRAFALKTRLMTSPAAQPRPSSSHQCRKHRMPSIAKATDQAIASSYTAGRVAATSTLPGPSTTTIASAGHISRRETAGIRRPKMASAAATAIVSATVSWTGSYASK